MKLLMLFPDKNWLCDTSIIGSTSNISARFDTVQMYKRVNTWGLVFAWGSLRIEIIFIINLHM